MQPPRASTALAMVLRVAVLTLPVLVLFTATVLPLALLLTRVPGAAPGLSDQLSLAVLCGLVVWTFLAVFHIRTETVRLPVPERKTFLQRLVPILEELGYEVARQGDGALVSRPGFKALLLGGAVQVRLEGTTARLTGPKVFIEIVRRRLRLQSYIDRAQQPTRESRQRPAERLLKRVEISLRLEGAQWPGVHEMVAEVLGREGAHVVCELHIMARSDAGVRETAIEELRERLQQNAVTPEIRKDFPQWEISAVNPDSHAGVSPASA